MQLEDLNDSELWEMARLQILASWGITSRLKRGLSRDRVIAIIEGNLAPHASEMAMDTRLKLQEWIAKSWEMVNSQLPCTGKDRGKCSIYECPEGRHLRCYEAAQPHFALT